MCPTTLADESGRGFIIPIGGGGDRVKEMTLAILPALLDGDREDLVAVAASDDAVDALHGKIIDYLGQISRMKPATT